jgi:hypothetical protein
MALRQILTNGPKSQGTIPGPGKNLVTISANSRTTLAILGTLVLTSQYEARRDPCKLDISAIFRSCPKILLRLVRKLAFLLRQILILSWGQKELVG